jgi:hypothetical protein
MSCGGYTRGVLDWVWVVWAAWEKRQLSCRTPYILFPFG